MIDVVLIGAGNVATHLAIGLHKEVYISARFLVALRPLLSY